MDNGMISVSMMCVHLGQIKEYLDAFKRNNIEYLHIDAVSYTHLTLPTKRIV